MSRLAGFANTSKSKIGVSGQTHGKQVASARLAVDQWRRDMEEARRRLLDHRRPVLPVGARYRRLSRIRASIGCPRHVLGQASLALVFVRPADLRALLAPIQDRLDCPTSWVSWDLRWLGT